METLEAIRTRRSVRRWQAKPVPEEVLNQVLEAGRWAPSAGNFQPWAFIVIEAAETKQRLHKLAEESKNLSRIWAPFYREGSPRGYVVDLTSVPTAIAVFADPRHAPPHTGGDHGHLISASLAAMNMWLAAHAQGLGACFWSHMMADKMKAILGVPHHWDFIGLLGLGYPEGGGTPEGYDTTDPKFWQRKPVEQIAHYEWYNCRKGEAPPEEKVALLQQYLNL